MELFSFCDCHPIIPWLLAGLLGLLLGWLLFAGARKRVKELEEENERIRGLVSGLEGDLSDCKAKRAALDSELTLLKGTIRERDQADAAREKAKTSEAVPEDTSPKEKENKSENLARASASVAAPLAAVSGVMASSGRGKPRNIYKVLTDDNLQIVEGIGPKMEEVLKGEDVGTWAKLAESTSESLRSLLDKVNAKRYRIIDPSTWPRQAGLAQEGDWEGLIAYQKNLDTGKAPKGGGTSDSKVEKTLIKMGALKRWKVDDLKAVEGIGPKIEGLLKTAGIDTWRKLSTASEESLRQILTDAGPRFRLADPSTWPKQAEMAADGRWDDLDEYQDFLQGGK